MFNRDRDPYMRWPLIAVLFMGFTVLWTYLAWDGDHFALIGLAVTSGFLALTVGFTGHHWHGTLTGWDRTIAGWQHAADYSAKQDKILRDALSDLSEYDVEATHIHQGRAMEAVVNYGKTLGKE